MCGKGTITGGTAYRRKEACQAKGKPRKKAGIEKAHWRKVECEKWLQAKGGENQD